MHIGLVLLQRGVCETPAYDGQNSKDIGFKVVEFETIVLQVFVLVHKGLVGSEEEEHTNNSADHDYYIPKRPLLLNQSVSLDNFTDWRQKAQHEGNVQKRSCPLNCQKQENIGQRDQNDSNAKSVSDSLSEIKHRC